MRRKPVGGRRCKLACVPPREIEHQISSVLGDDVGEEDVGRAAFFGHADGDGELCVALLGSECVRWDRRSSGQDSNTYSQMQMLKESLKDEGLLRCRIPLTRDCSRRIMAGNMMFL